MCEYEFESYVYMDAGEEVETPCTVEFYYQPKEKQTLEYKGCEAEVLLEGVFLDNNLYNYVDDIIDYDRRRLKEEAFEFIKKSEERDYGE